LVEVADEGGDAAGHVGDDVLEAVDERHFRGLGG
jgi:hypothetical protein